MTTPAVPLVLLGALSAAALLNTCFVEQKRLDRLESLDRNQRCDTINELLNLRILSELDAGFRIKGEDLAQFDTQKKRVRVADLDAQVPAREAEELVARRCLLYARALDAAEQVGRLTEQISERESARTDIAEPRDQMTAHLRTWDALKNRHSAIRHDLSHRARAWQTALEVEAAASRRLDDLEAQAALPGREEDLGAASDLCERLVALERLGTELDAARVTLSECGSRRRGMEAMQADLGRLTEDLRRKSEAQTEAPRVAALARARCAGELGACGGAADHREPGGGAAARRHRPARRGARPRPAGERARFGCFPPRSCRIWHCVGRSRGAAGWSRRAHGGSGGRGRRAGRDLRQRPGGAAAGLRVGRTR